MERSKRVHFRNSTNNPIN